LTFVLHEYAEVYVDLVDEQLKKLETMRDPLNETLLKDVGKDI
jgi:hypothetical protein